MAQLEKQGHYNVEAVLDFTTAEPTSPVKGVTYWNTTGGLTQNTGKPVPVGALMWDGSDYFTVNAEEGDDVFDKSTGQKCVFNGTDLEATSDDSVVNEKDTWSSQKIVDFVKALTADIETDPAKAGKISFANATAQVVNYTKGSHEYFLNDNYLTTLSEKGETFTFTGAEGDILSSPTGLFSCVSESGGTSSWATLGFAGKIFGISVKRNNPVTLKIASFETPPFVEVFDSSNNLVTSVSIGSNSLGTVSLPNQETYRVESTEDVSLFYQGTSSIDYAVVTPGSTEGYHWSTGPSSPTILPNISSIYDNTTIEVEYANGTIETNTLVSAGDEYLTINRGGQYAESCAYYWKSDRPVVAYAVADQDGSSASFGTPKTAMGNVFGIPLNAEHVSIISQTAGYVIRFDENGDYVDTTDFNNNGAENVWTMRFTNQIAGYTYVTSTDCTVNADFTHANQSASGGDESLVLGGKVSDLKQIPILDKNTGELSWLTLDSGSVSVMDNIGNSNVIGGASSLINDQSSSGYVDIGNTRIQWGNFATSNTDNDETITLPVAFSDSLYSVVITPTNGAAESAISDIFHIPTRTTTSFNINRDDNVDAFTTTVMWQAIGVKP